MQVPLIALGLAAALSASGFAAGLIALIHREGWVALAGLALAVAGLVLVATTPATVIFATFLIRGRA